MEISADSRRPGQRAGLDPFEIRREYLRAGGDINAVAEAHQVTRNAIKYQLARADAASPLTYQSGDPEDQRAMTAYVLKCLERAHISR